MRPLLDPPILFAHRGARAYERENTMEAFQVAVDHGVTGIESDVWITKDGVAVLDHDGVVRKGLRRVSIATVNYDDLPGHMPRLDELYEVVGDRIDVSLDLKDASALDATVAVARNVGEVACSKLWLCHTDWNDLAQWRSHVPDVKLVDSTRLKRMKTGPERRAADLAAANIDAVNLHASDWNKGLVTLFHRFEVLCFGWDAQAPRVMTHLLHYGCDAIYSDYPDRMVEVAAGNDL